MEFQKVADDMVKQIMPAVKKALSLNVSAADKQYMVEKVFKTIGNEFYLQLFKANSYLFDSMALGTLGWDEIDAAISGLARTIVVNGTTGIDYEQKIQSFFNTNLGKAQADAFQNAVSMGKHPTLTRTMTGKEDCAFCRSVAGTHINPSGKYFARCCSNCNCLIVVSGYNSRNGVVNNYVKGKK